LVTSQGQPAKSFGPVRAVKADGKEIAFTAVVRLVHHHGIAQTGLRQFDSRPSLAARS
jgi:hypothetical protein